GTGDLTFVEAQHQGVGGVDGLDSGHFGAVAPGRVTLSPDGSRVYVTGDVQGGVAVFARSASTGRLTVVESELDGVGGVSGLNTATGVAARPDGAPVYIGGGDLATARMDVAAFKVEGTLAWGHLLAFDMGTQALRPGATAPANVVAADGPYAVILTP